MHIWKMLVLRNPYKTFFIKFSSSVFVFVDRYKAYNVDLSL